MPVKLIAHILLTVADSHLIIQRSQIKRGKPNVFPRYWDIPGGRVEENELPRDAAVREVKEELGIDSRVNQLAFVVENQFTHEGIDLHNIEFHFIVDPIGETPEKMIEDQLKQTCEWIDVDKFVNLDIVPVFLAEELTNWSGQVKHIMNMKEKTT